MTDVVLIPTGKMEHAGLVPALSALFPEVEFVVEPPDEPLTGFTSADVRHLPAPQEFTEVSELAARLVAAVKPGRRGKRPTFAVAIDDLELVNNQHPAEVIAYFRRAVIEHVERVWRPPADADSVFKLVRECCSFHLFRPMTEAYFFGEPAALQRASVQRPSHLVDGLDFENFETTDSDYHALPAKSARIPDMPERQHHPKAYLNFLCDPTLTDKRRRYKETKNGVAALGRLDWQQVLSIPSHCPFLRAFLDDLACAVGQKLDWLAQPESGLTIFPAKEPRILRNI